MERSSRYSVVISPHPASLPSFAAPRRKDSKDILPHRRSRRVANGDSALPLGRRHRYDSSNIVNGGFPMSISSAARGLVLLAALLSLPGLAASRAEAALATDLGPEVATAQPANGFVGKLSVAPLHATEGANVTVSGESLPANQEFDLVWRTVKGSWKAANGEYHGRDYAPIGYRIARVKT